MTRYRASSWLDPRLELRSSAIHGRGLFATRPIKTGEVVIVFGGTLFSREDIAKGRANNRTLMQVDEETWLGSQADEPLGEDYFINHSCDPNLWMKDEATLVARRSIVLGEEVTMDYAMHFADPSWTMKPLRQCGSRLCRGHVTGKDWILEDLQKRYSAHVSPLVNRHISHFQASKGRGPSTRGKSGPPENPRIFYSPYPSQRSLSTLP